MTQFYNLGKFFLLSIFLCAMSCVPSFAIHRALIFGLGRQKDVRWGKIHGDNDVHYVVNMLQNMGYTDIKTLRNEQATKAGMVKAFKDLILRCKKGDIVYIHYSGHGQLMTDLDGDETLKWNGRHADWDESWIPYDAYMTYCKEDRGEKHFCDDEVATYLSQIRKKITHTGQITVVIDACHSGDATCGEDDECVRGVDVKFNIPKAPNAIMTPKILKENWQTISACKPYQLSAEIKDKQVGKLTFALYSLGKNALKMSNGNLEKKLSEFFAKHQGRLPQTPMITGKK